MPLKNNILNYFRKTVTGLLLICFISGQIMPPSSVWAQTTPVLNLPMPGAMVGISPSYVPIAIKGIKIFQNNPFRFDFLLDTGNSKLSPERLKEETKLLIKYFLTALTIPDKDQWVNLSPYENDRIVPNEFGITEMGHDLLAQDYLLKQLTASLVYPEQELGKRFWETVYKKAYEKYGDVDIPVSTFNKVWILPEHAKVYEYGTTAVITESHLKVMLEEDYLAFIKSQTKSPDEVVPVEANKDNAFGSEIVKEIVLPEIEKEINEGKNFAKLRQIYHSMILAAWFKRKLKEGILAKLYVGTNKVAGVDVADKKIKQKIYDQYLVAFKKGVYNYIREDVDVKIQKIIPRKYFSGGVVAGLEVDKTTEVISVTEQQQEQAAGDVVGNSLTASAVVDPLKDGKSIGLNESTQEKPNGGALKQIGVLGQQDSVSVPTETLQRWSDLASVQNLQQREIVGENITAKIIQSEDDDTSNGQMPDGLFAYHFRNAQGDLVIVLSSSLTSQDEIDEAIYHEFREDHWERELAARDARGELSVEDKARVPWIAHVLASTEESIAFGHDRNAITSYHKKQIESLETAQLEALIKEDRNVHEQVIRTYLKQEEFTRYLQYEEMMRAEMVSSLSARKPVSRSFLELPSARFGAAVDLEHVLEEAARETLGYVPLFSVYGSYTYMRTAEGSPDWDHIGDLDIRIHARKSLSFQQYIDFKTKVFEKLGRQKGLIVDSKGIDDPQKRGSDHIYWGIRDIKTNNSLVLTIHMGNLDDVFEGKGSFMSYRVTDRFFGDLSALEALTKNLSEKDILQTTVQFYRSALREVKSVTGDPYTSKSVSGKLKTFYQLAFMRGKAEEYRWLIDQADRFNEQFKRNAFDAVDFGGVTARALQGLDVDEQILISDLSKVYRDSGLARNMQGALAPQVRVEVPLFSNEVPYVAFDQSHPLSLSKERGTMLDGIVKKSEKEMAAALTGTNIPVAPEAKEYMLNMVQDFFRNGVDAILQRLDTMNGPGLNQAIRQAHITYSYREHPNTNEFEIVVSDTGVGIKGDILDNWQFDEYKSTKPAIRDGNGGYLRGPYYGKSAEGMVLNFKDAVRLGMTLTIISKSQEDGVTRKLVQTPDGKRTVVDFPEGRSQVGTDMIITGNLAGGLSDGQTGTAPVQDAGKVNTPGGIDMNQKALNLQTEGSGVKFDMPFDPAHWENIKFDGFTPVILQINTTNLPVFLGAQESDKTIQLSSV